MFTVTIERSDEELLVRIGKKVIVELNHDEHGYVGMAIPETIFEAMAKAGYCKLVNK